MRIVAVEEHFTVPNLAGKFDRATLVRNGWPAPGTTTFKAVNPPTLEDTGAERITAMESAGICMQVLSVPGPGAEIVSGPDGIAIAREYNDRMARLWCARPAPAAEASDRSYGRGPPLAPNRDLALSCARSLGACLEEE